MSSGTTKDLKKVFGYSPSDVYAVGDDGMILHYDGISWSAHDMVSASLVSIWGSSPESMYAVGARGTVLRHTCTGAGVPDIKHISQLRTRIENT